MRTAIRKVHTPKRPLNPADYLAENALAIFLFHGVIERNIDEVRNYTGKHVLKDDFVQMIVDLRHVGGHPVSMDDVIEYAAASKSFPPHSFAITFDDGFANNYDIAAPILVDYEVPAMFYVTTGFIEHNRMAWIDRIEYCFARADTGKLLLPWYEGPRSFCSRADKIQFLDDIRFHAKRDPQLNLDELVTDIFSQCRVAEIWSSPDPLDQKMKWNQIAELNRDTNFQVGGHTHTHRILSFLKPDELEEEVSLSLRLLREKSGIDPKHYSYPEGLAHCYNDQVIDVLARHGVVCCPTAEHGLNDGGENLFHLKRIMVG